MIEPNLVEFVIPPAVVREDEQAKYQRLIEQGREATALAAEGKHATVEWVTALLAAYPPVESAVFRGQLIRNPKVYEIVRAVRGGTDSAIRVFLNRYKSEAARSARQAANGTSAGRSRKIRAAAVEITTKYRLGADPKECMDRLAAFIEEQTRG